MTKNLDLRLLQTVVFMNLNTATKKQFSELSAIIFMLFCVVD